MNKAIVSLFTAMAMAAPAFAGDSAISALLGGTDPQAVREMVPQAPAAKLVCATKAPTQAWVAEVKKVYAGLIESWDLFQLPQAKKSELPAAALKQLNKDNAGQHSYGPTFAATAYKVMVKGLPAFIIHNDKDGHSLTAHIFDASGKLVARGHADESTPLYWDNLNASSSGSSSGGYSGSTGGYVNPGYNHGSGPDAIDDGMGNGPTGGGPDDTDWDGCGSTGSGNGSDPDGSGGGVLF